MGIIEDREEFNNTGPRGLLKRIMKEKDEAYIQILDGGWRGNEVPEKPKPGSGPYLHYRRGYPVLEYSNQSPSDTSCKTFRMEV